jgi:hypothetical protein
MDSSQFRPAVLFGALEHAVYGTFNLLVLKGFA